MIIKITSKRQVTFPKKVMEALNLKTGDRLSISEADNGIVIRPHRFDPSRLAPLKKQIDMNLSAPDLDKIRHAAAQKHLRD